MLPSSSTTLHSPTTSLHALVSDAPTSSRLRYPADALAVIGRQLELIVQADGLAADVALGTLRFSLFRLHQGRIAQLAAHCRSVTVYGLADVAPAPIPGVTFVPLPPDSPLCQEWFLIVDSPTFWGSLIARAVPDEAGRYHFEGVLTPDAQVVGGAMRLLRGASDAVVRDAVAHSVRWGRVAHALAAHPEAERLRLADALGAFPELGAILAQRAAPPDALLAHTLAALQRHYALGGVVAYRRDDSQLSPVAWSTSHQPVPLPIYGALGARVLAMRQPLLVALAEMAPGVLPDAAALLAVPIVVQGRLWGVIVAEYPSLRPETLSEAGPLVAAAALLAEILPPPLPSPAIGAPASFLRAGFSAAPLIAGGLSSLPAFRPAEAPEPRRDPS